MTVKFNATGSKRKELVQLIAHFTGYEVKYNGVPSFAYEVGEYTIDKEGNLHIPETANDETVERLLEMLYDNSFEGEIENEKAEEVSEPKMNGSIYVRKEMLGDTAYENLQKILNAKGELIKKALRLDSLEIIDDVEFYEFPWVAFPSTADDVYSVTQFITALCEMANNQKRINETKTEVTNEKYAFRCFLLRLGFIGDEYKGVRKNLLKNLEGSSAFKNGRKNEVLENA